MMRNVSWKLSLFISKQCCGLVVVLVFHVSQLKEMLAGPSSISFIIWALGLNLLPLLAEKLAKLNFVRVMS